MVHLPTLCFMMNFPTLISSEWGGLLSGGYHNAQCAGTGGAAFQGSVNWEFSSYCFDRFDDSDDFNLRNGKEAYGQGIWAPAIRYHNGKFYIFSNINGHGLQVYISDSAKGPWTHHKINGDIYDLSVLFDEDGKIYAVHKYGNVTVTELKPDLSGPVEGSSKVVIPEGNAMGEGHHVYKINGMYYILSADYSPMGRMQCARSKSIRDLTKPA